MVPVTKCAGKPIDINMGSVRSPPPPQTASMMPAKKKAMQIIAPGRLNISKVTVINLLFYRIGKSTYAII